jgi:hypothetical protein
MTKKLTKPFDIETLLRKYDYLDRLPLAGWLWEFLRRNKQYRDLYEDFLENEDHLGRLEWWQKVYPENGRDCPSQTDAIWFSLMQRARSFRLRKILDPDLTAPEIGIKALARAFLLEPAVVSLFVGTHGKEDGDDHDTEGSPPNAVICSSSDFLLHEMAIKIDLSVSEGKLVPLIKEIIKKQKIDLKEQMPKPKRKGELFRRWKENLITYEMMKLRKTKQLKTKDIHDLLNPKLRHGSGNHPFSCPYCKNVRKHSHDAKTMINGKYREYLKYMWRRATPPKKAIKTTALPS